MAADALAPYVVRTSAAMILTISVFEIVLGELMDSRSINELTFGGPTFTFGGPKKYAISKKVSLNHDFTK